MNANELKKDTFDLIKLSNGHLNPGAAVDSKL